jgi:hypothetical protein
VVCRTSIRPAAKADSPSHGPLCGACLDALTADLSRIPRLYAETEQALAPGTARSLVRVSGSRHTTPMPVRGQVVQARTALRSALSSWSALVADERRVAGPRPDIREMTSFLRLHLSWLVRHPALPDLVGELRDAVRLTLRSLQSGQSRQVQLSSCREDGCSGSLIAHMNSGASGPPSEIRCDSDPSHRWAPREWHAFIQRPARTH